MAAVEKATTQMNEVQNVTWKTPRIPVVDDKSGSKPKPGFSFLESDDTGNAGSSGSSNATPISPKQAPAKTGAPPQQQAPAPKPPTKAPAKPGPASQQQGPAPTSAKPTGTASAATPTLDPSVKKALDAKIIVESELTLANDKLEEANKKLEEARKLQTELQNKYDQAFTKEREAVRAAIDNGKYDFGSIVKAAENLNAAVRENSKNLPKDEAEARQEVRVVIDIEMHHLATDCLLKAAEKRNANNLTLTIQQVVSWMAKFQDAGTTPGNRLTYVVDALKCECNKSKIDPKGLISALMEEYKNQKLMLSVDDAERLTSILNELNSVQKGNP